MRVMLLSDFKLKMTGDWKKAGIYLKNLAVKLRPAFELLFYEDGEFILKEIRGHIDKQDLNWKPLAERTVELKGGDDTIYIETGELYNGLSVRRIKSTTKGTTLFIGASPWKKHKESGLKLNDLMIWLEYGTDKMVARPLIQPTYEEVQEILKKHWKDLMKELVKG